jgi:hypothetical protein
MGHPSRRLGARELAQEAARNLRCVLVRIERLIGVMHCADLPPLRFS